MLIQCKLGPRQIDCGGFGYDFVPDAQGRAVAEVHHAAHIKSFLAVTHYQEVLPEAEPPAENDDGNEEPPKPNPPKRGRKARS